MASKNNPELKDEFKEQMRYIELNSEEAIKLKKRYQLAQEHMAKEDEKHLLDPSPAKRIVKHLDDFERGNHAAWWHLNLDLTLEPDSKRYVNEFEPDLTTLPGWNSAEDATRIRIINAARRYLFKQDPEASTWIGQNIIHRPAFAGYRALRLLLKEASSDISSLPQYIWRKWAPIILSYPLPGSRDVSTHRNLIRIAYQNAPEEIIETLMLLIDKENREMGNIFVIREIEDCWDERLANRLLNKVKEKDFKPACMGTILGLLLDQNNKDSRKFAESLVTSRDILVGEEQSRAVIAASMLIRHSEDAGWSIVWPAIQKDSEFGKAVIALLSQYHYGPARNDLNLNESQLADLYIWLARQYPHKEDPSHKGGVFKVGAREYITDFRDSILNQLKLIGKIESCEEIRRIQKELPDLDMLKWVLYDSETITRRKMWRPYPAEKIIELVQQINFG